MQRLGSYLSRVGITQLSRSLSLKATPRASDSFLSGTNAYACSLPVYAPRTGSAADSRVVCVCECRTALEQLYQNWEADPKSVDPTWRTCIASLLPRRGTHDV